MTISPSEFVARWGSDELVRFPTKGVDRLPLAAEDKAFLSQAGLPAEAAPFLTFDAPQSADLPTVAKQWGVADEFRRYRVIGSDGSGNPIALDEQSEGEVVRLDHENRFSRALMNRSVRQMAESLLAYRQLVEDTQAEFGPDAFLDGKASAAARNKLREELTKIDSAAVTPGCFWHGELQILDANAV
jgi:hypothetical protein